MTPTPDPKKTIRVKSLHDHTPDDDLANTTPAERIGMMWQLAVDAWAFKGEEIADPRVSRRTVRVLRRQR